MTFSVKDRIVLPPLLPTTGSYTTMVVRRDLIDKLAISQEEIKRFELQATEDERIVWNEAKQEDKEIELTDLELKLIKDTLEELDKKEGITDDTIELYKKFMVA